MRLLNQMTHWVDHVTQHPGRRKYTQNDDGSVDVVKAEGKIIQQGTARNGSNYNNMETSIRSANVFCSWLWTIVKHHRYKLEDLTGEFGEIDLTNTKKYPFSNASVTVPLDIKRSTKDYRVNVEVVSATEGLVERAAAYDRQLNGFKICFTGSAKNVKIKYCITGGRIS